MKTYWDHSEKERAELSREDVQSLLKFELMEKGVVAPSDPEYLPETAPELPTTTMYRVKCGYSSGDLLFATADNAAQAIALSAGWTKTEYLAGTHLQTVDYSELEISTCELNSAADIAKHRSALEEAASNKAANKKARDAFNAECNAVEEVTSHVWEDWHEMRAKLARLTSVNETLDEYLEMCDGNESLAKEFLAKAFAAETIAEADEWFPRASNGSPLLA